MTCLLDSLPEVIAKVISEEKTGRTRRSGEITVSSAAIREAARQVGLEHVSRHELGVAMKAIGAKVHTQTATGPKYVFPGALHTDDVQRAVEQRSTALYIDVTHLGGFGLEARVIASLTFPQGFSTKDGEFSGNYRDYSADDIKLIDATVMDSSGIRSSKAACVTLHLRPDSEAARNLLMLIPSRHEFAHTDSVTNTEGADIVSFGLTFDDGSTADLSGGAYIGRFLTEEDAQFTFFFADVNQDN